MSLWNLLFFFFVIINFNLNIYAVIQFCLDCVYLLFIRIFPPADFYFSSPSISPCPKNHPWYQATGYTNASASHTTDWVGFGCGFAPFGSIHPPNHVVCHTFQVSLCAHPSLESSWELYASLLFSIVLARVSGKYMGLTFLPRIEYNCTRKSPWSGMKGRRIRTTIYHPHSSVLVLWVPFGDLPHRKLVSIRTKCLFVCLARHHTSFISTWHRLSLA